MSEKSKKNQTIQYYDQNAACFVENTRDVDFHVIQDEFLEKLPAEAQILDLGCGSGRDTKYFLEHGYQSMPSTVPQNCAHWQRNTQVFR